MKLLRKFWNYDYYEIEVEDSFLMFKWRKIYRKRDGVIMRYKHPDKYYDLGIGEYIFVKELFSMPNPEINK